MHLHAAMSVWCGERGRGRDREIWYQRSRFECLRCCATLVPDNAAHRRLASAPPLRYRSPLSHSIQTDRFLCGDGQNKCSLSERNTEPNRTEPKWNEQKYRKYLEHAMPRHQRRVNRIEWSWLRFGFFYWFRFWIWICYLRMRMLWVFLVCAPRFRPFVSVAVCVRVQLPVDSESEYKYESMCSYPARSPSEIPLDSGSHSLVLCPSNEVHLAAYEIRNRFWPNSIRCLRHLTITLILLSTCHFCTRITFVLLSLAAFAGAFVVFPNFALPKLPSFDLDSDESLWILSFFLFRLISWAGPCERVVFLGC